VANVELATNNKQSNTVNDSYETVGNDKSTFYLSFGTQDQQGIVATEISNFKKQNIRLNATHKISKVFTLGQTLGYTHAQSTGIGNTNSEFGGPLSSAINLDPITQLVITDPLVAAGAPYSVNPVIRDRNGNPYGISNIVGQEMTNPLAYIQTRLGQYNWSDDMIGNAYLEANISNDISLNNYTNSNNFNNTNYYNNINNYNNITNPNSYLHQLHSMVNPLVNTLSFNNNSNYFNNEYIPFSNNNCSTSQVYNQSDLMTAFSHWITSFPPSSTRTGAQRCASLSGKSSCQCAIIASSGTARPNRSFLKASAIASSIDLSGRSVERPRSSGKPLRLAKKVEYGTGKFPLLLSLGD
jgi:hypothetical protein